MTPVALATIGLSIALQMLAAIQALRLIRVTGWHAAWTMIAVALLIMAGRRAVSLAHMVVDGRPIDLLPELLALVISALMLVGVQRISTLLRAWSATRERDAILRHAQQDFIATTDPFHGQAFQRLADDLAGLGGWEAVAIGLRDGGGAVRPLALGGPRRSRDPDAAQDLLAAGWKTVRNQATGGGEWVEVDRPDEACLAFPVVSGSETVGLLVFARPAASRHGGRIEGMDSIVLAIGGMIGALRFQRQREQADQDQRRLILELERSNRELEQFAYISSHDMQEPLRMIVLYLELLKRRYEGVLDEQGRDYLGFAVEGARHMHAMILDLLQYCRLGQDGTEPAPPADSGEALDVAARELAAHSFELTVAAPLPRVAMPSSELERVFLNLLGNAIKFRSPGRMPAIAVDARPEGDVWHFRVADNGIGIDPAYFDKIFQVFQRLHTRTEYEGTGIGLAFVKKAVEYRGGKVWAESEPGHGATFHFTLPAA